MVFSTMLWMPSWGGMINGLMTLSGAWDKLRTDPVLRLMVVSVAFYGLSTFEGPLVEIVPLFYLKSTIEKVEGIRPYLPRARRP